MTSFLSEEEQKISNQFEKEGFIIADIKDKESLKKIENIFIKSIKKNIK